MRKLGIVSAVALALTNAPAMATDGGGSDAATQVAAMQSAADARLAQMKSILRLRPEQERLWAPVEAAVRRAILQHNAEEKRSGGFVRWVSDKAQAAAGEALAIKRAIAAARPLIRTLDAEQRRDALDAARAMGLGALAAAL